MFFPKLLRSRYPQILLFLFLISAFFGLGCKRKDAPDAPSSRPAGYVERMAKEHKDDAPSTSPLSSQKPRQEVIDYGRLVLEREKLATLQMPILGIFGALDRGIPLEKVKEFQATLHALKKDATILIYPGADHAFANPSGKRYQAKAAEEAWKQTLAFFKKHLRS